MISIGDIQEAAQRIKGRVQRTPLVFSSTFSKMTGAEVYLKLENLQLTGSFKVRGATNRLFKRRGEIGPEGVVAASAGNHAQGVALAAREAGVRATIVMPLWASITKQEATRGYGGEVILAGESLTESLEKARELARSGMTFIHPYDDPDIMAGQGTLGLEIMEDLPDAAVVVAAIGGGGLISGISTAVKALNPGTRVIGVQAAACPSAVKSLENGGPLTVAAQKSIADGISVKQIGQHTFPIIRDKVDEVVLVDEEQIAAAIVALLERKKVLAEGAGAVPLAALLSGRIPVPAGAKVVLAISGGNVDSPILGRVIRRGMARGGRIMRFSVLVDDVPGMLAGLLAVVASAKANVLDISHDRLKLQNPINSTEIFLELETRSRDHQEEVREALAASGYNARDCLAAD